MDAFDYSVRVREAIAAQKRMAGGFASEGFPEKVRFVGGADAAFAPADAQTVGGRSGNVGCPAVAIAVVWDLLEMRIVEKRYARKRVAFPYVPGLLSFREAPLLVGAMRRIETPVDVWMFDGQGIAHPRGVGLATHMGLLLDVPTVGAAKSVLVGSFDAMQRREETLTREDGAVVRFAWTPIAWRGREIGRALWRDQKEAAPMIVSPGHKCSQEQAMDLVARCTLEGRLPEPTRVADLWTKRVRAVSAREGRRRVEGGEEEGLFD